MTKTDLNTLAHADLERSGITPQDAETLGITTLNAQQTQILSVSFEPLPSLRFDYYDPCDKSKLLTMFPAWPGFYRIRYLEGKSDFSKATDKKSQRYTQEPDSGVCSYFPRCIEWTPLMQDYSQSLIITEGEKKSAKACLSGYPTIGLGGVYSFRSARLGISFLPELERIKWARRRVYIAYDSDARTNPQVCHALTALAEELTQRGALPYTMVLPSIYDDGRKTGLDDLLVAGHSLDMVLAQAEPLTLSQTLWGLNGQVTYVCDPGLIIERSSRARISPGAFKEHRYSSASYAERVLKEDGAVSLKRVGAAAAWLKWPLRSEVSRLTYMPGHAEDVEERGQRLYNMWPGWGVGPSAGSVKPFLALVDHLFKGSPDEEKQWFLRWLAYPIQRPGTKLFTAVIMYGRRHGTGKSLIGLTMGRIYGANFSEISQADLEGSFNEWAVGKQFVLGDDVTGSDRRAHADQLKKLITQKEMRVNQKFVPTYTVPDCLNYYFTSNQPDAFVLEDDDRRYFVHEVSHAPLEQDFYSTYAKWLEKDGAPHLFSWLLDLDLGDFNPAAPALRTDAKDAMTLDIKSDCGVWVRQLMEDPDTILKVGDALLTKDIYTTAQLLGLFDPLGRTNVTANGLGRELKRAGVLQVEQGKSLRTDAGVGRYYIVRNATKWGKATALQCRAHIDKV